MRWSFAVILNLGRTLVFQAQTKGSFFQKVRYVFQIPKSQKKRLFQITILNLNFPPMTVNSKFKFQAQDSNLEYFHFGDLEI